ncbi:zinc finger and SCAN domain-containing protein 4 [Orycteropus afer afer]|uniref:Zinc finger and SCAN domain-containing protein 4 n=1 Tax=Orycteropus afer afer TaxID=1230840 RepID=A0A8B7B6G9_ORYAF|nr:zinc finger and SCAN domain-containing protein 4 [Orycteropus afer afer]
MALDLRTSCRRDSRRKAPGSGHAEPERARAPGFPKRGGSSGLPSSALGVFPYSNTSYARQELQRLQKAFHRWLRPEQHSKDEMIAQLAREQLLMDERRRDRSVWREEWDSGGRSLEKFMEDLADDCMEPPGYVHVYMQGQEALFSENMPLRDVIFHLTKQLSAGTPTGKNTGTPIQTPQDPSTQTGCGE